MAIRFSAMDNAPKGTLPRNLQIALGIFIFCCLLSTARIARQAPRPWRLQPDEVAQRSDQRFSAVKQVLPSSGVIGYIGEPGESFLPDYYLAQYALAPLIVDRSIRHQIVLGNFPRLQVPPALQGLRKIQDFGNGVVLLSNEDTP